MPNKARHLSISLPDKYFNTGGEYLDLLKKYDKKLPKPDLFNQDIDINDQLIAAYKLHNKDIGWNSEIDQNGDM